MTKASETPTPPRKPDGIMTTQIKGQTLITEIYFNHDSKETFEDKLLKAVSADKSK
jgi:hypothetical protein